MCRVVGPLNRVTDFLCERCVHPDEIRTFCASCGDRQGLVPGMGLEWLVAILPEVSHAPGTAIRLQQCPACAPGQGLGFIEVYRLRANAPPTQLSGQSIEVV